MTLCSLPNCGKKLHARGLCRNHYDRRWQNKQVWRARHPEKTKEYSRVAYAANRETQREKSKAWYEAHSEWVSVRSHWYYIFGKKPLPAYHGMPFFRDWNPSHLGGSWETGARWIIENLGRRPDRGYDLHIVEKTLGFVPGNLQWVPRDKHRREEMVYRLLRENQNLKKRLEGRHDVQS